MSTKRTNLTGLTAVILVGKVVAATRGTFATPRRVWSVGLASLVLLSNVGFVALTHQLGADAMPSANPAPRSNAFDRMAARARAIQAEQAALCRPTTYHAEPYFEDIGQFAKVNFGVVSLFDAEGRERARRQSSLWAPELLLLDDAGQIDVIYNNQRGTVRGVENFLSAERGTTLAPADPAFDIVLQSRRALAVYDGHC